MYPKIIMMLEIESAKGSVNNHIYRGAMAFWPSFMIRSLASDTDMLYCGTGTINKKYEI